MAQTTKELGVQPDTVASEEVMQEIVHEPLPQHHDYVQHGGMVECRSCPIRHGFYLGPDKIIAKTKEGGYEIQKRRFV